jgi:hypothetical protein
MRAVLNAQKTQITVIKRPQAGTKNHTIPFFKKSKKQSRKSTPKHAPIKHKKNKNEDIL